MKPYIVGECPSRGGDSEWRTPLGQQNARRLCQMAGFDPIPDDPHHDEWIAGLYAHYCAVNLIKRHVEVWPRVRAEEAAVELDRKIATGPRVAVLCGRRVATAFGFKTTWPMCKWAVTRAGLIVMIPHPSGLNRTLNDEAIRERVGRTLRDAVAMAGDILGVDT